MAAVTVDSRVDAVFGNYRVVVAQVDIAASGDTWDTNVPNVLFVTTNDVAVTKSAPSGDTITFTTTGAVTNAKVLVIGQ